MNKTELWKRVEQLAKADEFREEQGALAILAQALMELRPKPKKVKAKRSLRAWTKQRCPICSTEAGERCNCDY